MLRPEVPVRKVDIYYDSNCGFCIQSVAWLNRFDWFNRIRFSPISNLNRETKGFNLDLLRQAIGLRNENGEIYYGADAFVQVSARCPALLPFNILMKIPGAIYLARYVYGIIARNRMSLSCSGDAACSLPDKK